MYDTGVSVCTYTDASGGIQKKKEKVTQESVMKYALLNLIWQFYSQMD